MGPLRANKVVVGNAGHAEGWLLLEVVEGSPAVGKAIAHVQDPDQARVWIANRRIRCKDWLQAWRSGKCQQNHADRSGMGLDPDTLESNHHFCPPHSRHRFICIVWLLYLPSSTRCSSKLVKGDRASLPNTVDIMVYRDALVCIVISLSDLMSKTATCLECGNTVRVVEGSDNWNKVSNKFAWEEAELMCSNCTKTTTFVIDVDDSAVNRGSGLPPSS